MKSIIYLIFTSLALVLGSCGNSGNLSDAYGTFEATEILVSAETSGKIVSMNCTEGQTVEQGQLLCIVDTAQQVINRNQLLAQKQLSATKTQTLETQIAVQEEQKRSLQIDFDRLKKMFTDGAATQKQLDDIDGRIKVIDRTIENIRSQYATISGEQKVIDQQIQNVELQLLRSYVKAPGKGTILEKYSEAGEMAIPGKNLLKMADISSIYLRVYVSGNQLPMLKLGQQVQVLADNGKEGLYRLTGAISWISAESEFTPKVIQTREERVNLVYAVKILVPNDGTLKIGMPGEMNITLAQ